MCTQDPGGLKLLQQSCYPRKSCEDDSCETATYTENQNVRVSDTRVLRRMFCIIWKYLSESSLKEVLHPWTLFLKILCVFSNNKATLHKVANGSDWKCSKELKNHSFISVETMVLKLL